MDKFKVGIIGVTEPFGGELVRLLLQHPLAELTAVSRVSGEDSPLSSIYPSFYGIFDDMTKSDEEVVAASDIVICALDSSDNQELAAYCIKEKRVFIDMGTAFRLFSEEEYNQWYGGSYTYSGLHEAAVYGLPELKFEEITGRVLVACPGSVASAALLALTPALSEGLISPAGIVVDAMLPSGVFGSTGGHMLSLGAEGFRETAEIEQFLSSCAGASVRVAVSPHIVSSPRGLLVTCYAKANLAANHKTLRTAYEKFYADDTFIRLLPSGSGASTAGVCGSNLCDISLHFDERTATVAVCAAMDILLKGSAGAAIQCMNLLLSLPEATGLSFFPNVI